jgi:hypothetical protein
MKPGSALARTLLVLSAVAAGQCARRSPAQTDSAELAPVLSVKELMEQIVDPVADWVFDAAVIDVTEKGIVETVPLTDDDWQKVERGAMILAESANLLKMPRAMVAPGDTSPARSPGGPELTPGEIEAMIRRDPASWNRQADLLRTAAIESLTIIKRRDAAGLFDVGDKIDRACESCHLEYWYPGDKQLVLENQRKKVTFDPPKH